MEPGPARHSVWANKESFLRRGETRVSDRSARACTS